MKRRLMSAALVLLCAAACVEVDDYGTLMAVGGGTVVSLRLEGVSEACTRSSLGDVESVFSGGYVAVYDHDSGKLNSEYPLESLSGTLELKVPSGRNLDYFVAANMDFDFPKNEEELFEARYRIGRFADLAEKGIPVVGKATCLRDSREVTVQLHRLLAKISLTIDHSGLDGGADEDYFRNSKLYVRQANAVLKPFGGRSAALSEDELLAEGDFDPEMRNSNSSTFVYYAPENFGSRYPTYVEFTGIVDPAAGGYGGTVRYRFYVGGDDGLVANGHYRVTLGFKTGSLFEPSWSVELGDDWTDGRRIALAADPEGRDVLPQGKVVAVRPSRDGVCYLYFDKGDGVNHASELELCGGTFSPSDLADAAWSIDAPGLAEKGLVMDSSGDRLAFRVADPSRFVPGNEVPLTLHLYPGDLKYNAVLKTYDDISVDVDGGLSLDSDFYVGMKRGLTVRGLAGTVLYYRNAGLQSDLGITVSPAADASPVGPLRTGVPAGEALHLYACSSVMGSDFILELSTDDPFNDGDMVMRKTVNVDRARVAHNGYDIWYMGIDGSEKDVNYRYLDAAGEVIDRSRFDNTLYSRLLEPSAQYSTDSGYDISAWIGQRGGVVWLKALVSSEGKDVRDAVAPENYMLGMIRLGPKDPDAAAGSTGAFLFVHEPELLGDVPSRVETDYLNVPGPSGIHTSWTAKLWGCEGFEAVFEGPGATANSLDATSMENGFHRIDWHFEDSEGPGRFIPYGAQKTIMRFVNKHSGETFDLEAAFDLVHNVKLGVYALFIRNSPLVHRLFLTSEKLFYWTKCVPDGGDIPYKTTLANIPGTWNNYLRINVMKTMSFGYQVENNVYGRNFVTDYAYQDFNPAAYGRAEVWSEANIRAFAESGRSPFREALFTTPGQSPSVLPMPLPAEYSGNPYLNISVENRLRDYYIIGSE